MAGPRGRFRQASSVAADQHRLADQYLDHAAGVDAPKGLRSNVIPRRNRQSRDRFGRGHREQKSSRQGFWSFRGAK